MKKLLCLLALASGAASAESDLFSYKALKGVSVCTEYFSVFTNSEVKNFLGDQFPKDLTKQIENRMVAYRVKTTPDCTVANARTLNVSIEMTKSEAATKAFIVVFSLRRIDSKDFYPVTYWQDYSYGYSQKSAVDIAAFISQTALNLFDGFAADYARANP